MTVLIKEAEVAELITPVDALEAVRQAHLDLASGKVDNVVRSRARSPQMSLHTLSANSVALGLGAAKVYSAGREQMRSLVLLFELSSGNLLAIIEANGLGRFRTAAASMLSTQLMLGEIPLSATLIGTGYQAWGVAQSIAALSSDKVKQKLFIFSRSPEKRATFAEEINKQLGISAIAANTGEEAVAQGAVLFTATTSSSPVVEKDWLRNTKHIAALGSNALTRQEMPPHAVSGASLVFVDDFETARKEGGNLIKALENGKLFWSQVHELSEILKDPLPFQAKIKTGYSLFSSQGLAVQDLYLAQRIYQKFTNYASVTPEYEIKVLPLF